MAMETETPVRTHIHLRIYRFIDLYHAEHQYAPSLQDISTAFPAKDGQPSSSSVVRYWLDRMEELKMIAPRLPGIPRSIRPLPLDRKSPVIREMLKHEAEAKAMLRTEKESTNDNT